jgi:mRNA interferase MazF
MLRSEIRLIEFGEAMPGESAYRRPAVIVSNDGANSTAARLGRGVITVVPVTSNVSTIYPFQVHLAAEVTGLDRDSKAQAEQIRSVSIGRVGDRLGSVSAPLMLELDEAIRLHLSL